MRGLSRCSRALRAGLLEGGELAPLLVALLGDGCEDVQARARGRRHDYLGDRARWVAQGPSGPSLWPFMSTTLRGCSGLRPLPPALRCQWAWASGNREDLCKICTKLFYTRFIQSSSIQSSGGRGPGGGVRAPQPASETWRKACGTFGFGSYAFGSRQAGLDHRPSYVCAPTVAPCPFLHPARPAPRRPCATWRWTLPPPRRRCWRRAGWRCAERGRPTPSRWM